MTDGVRSLSSALDGSYPATGEEVALVGELQAGSEEAFAYLVAVYENPVFNLVFHILANGSEAADAVQEVFVKVFRGIKQFHGESSLKTWIYRIAVHEASNHRRGWWRRRAHEPVSLDDALVGRGYPAQAMRDTETPYESLEQAERQAMVKRALAGLPHAYRTVVVLREVEELSYDEIAQVLGIAEGTVKSRLMRGRELLRRKLAASLGH